MEEREAYPESSGEIMNEGEKKKSVFDIGRLKKENFVVILLIGVLLLVITWPISDEKTGKSISQSTITDTKTDILKTDQEGEAFTDVAEGEDWQTYISYLEQTLEELLSTVEGAGKVKVMITLKDSGEAIVEKDITTEVGGTTQVEAEGSSNNSSDRSEVGETVYETAGSGVSIPYVKQVITPQIEGVVVSVQGGDNLQLNKNITEAIQALFGIEVHKIKIIKMSSNS